MICNVQYFSLYLYNMYYNMIIMLWLFGAYIKQNCTVDNNTGYLNITFFFTEVLQNNRKKFNLNVMTE